MEKARYAMTLDALQTLLNSGQFHHATYRNVGTLWEGLWIYEKNANGFRGYSVVGSFPKGDRELEQAHKLVRGSGISVGSFGRG